jgi:hypothetical protein
MGWFLLILSVLVVLAFVQTPTVSYPAPNVSLNEITYPASVTCENCLNEVKPNAYTIDTGTWDLKCTCGHIAYKHPKRQQRIEQLNYLLDQTS